MTHFQHGDRISIRQGCSGTYTGDICIIVEDRGHMEAVNENENSCSCQDNWILLPDTPKINFRKVGSKQIIMKS